MRTRPWRHESPKEEPLQEDDAGAAPKQTTPAADPADDEARPTGSPAETPLELSDAPLQDEPSEGANDDALATTGQTEPPAAPTADDDAGPVASPDATDLAGEPEDEPAAEWSGGALEPYAVGDPGRAAREVVATLSANPKDPADTQLDGGVVGSLVVRAATSRGVSHRHSGTPRQDDYAVCVADGRWIVVAVADGVSAGVLSHNAATIAARASSELVRDALPDHEDLESIPWSETLQTVAQRIVKYGRGVIEADGSDEEVTAADVAQSMATTLVVAVLSVEPDDQGTRRGVALAFGDTSVFLLRSGGVWTPITRVKNEGAEIASSATVALPYVPSELEPLNVWLDPGDALFVMTDGVADALGRGDGPVGRFLASVWEAPPDLLSFGGQVGFARRSFDDDRTVVGIWAAT